MKKIYALLFSTLFTAGAFAQTVCNASGNLVIFSNYDGGTLNINVDQNIPNLKIGIVSYEAVSVNVSGAFASNLTGIAYAGYNNSPNTNCTPSIATTAFSGIGSASSNIAFVPPATLVNINGYTSIDCAYSCSITTNQGGCNTVDQVENYFLTYFPGSVLFSNKVQYGCWSGIQTVSTGGTCCALTTGVETFTSQNSISVFPNPTTNSINLSFQTALKSAIIKVFSVSGELVKEENGLNGNDVSVDVSSFPKGLYFIETTNGDNVSHTKFIKE